MALRTELRNIVINLLRNVSRSELREMTKALIYFNEFNCDDDERAGLMENGTTKPNSIENRLREEILEKTANQNLYMQVSRPVCRCCGR